MNEQDRLAKISTEVQKEQLALDSQLAEVKKMDAELARKRDTLDPADAAGKQAITEEEAKRDGVAETYNTRLRALREQGKTFDEGRAAWVQRCTTRDYDELDEAAIMNVGQHRHADLASRFGERPPSSRDIHISLRLSQQELGDLVGATRESVNKHLNDWTRQGFLRLQAGHMVIADIESVRRLARVAEE